MVAKKGYTFVVLTNSILLITLLCQASDGSAVTPQSRTDGWWMKRHVQINNVVEAAGENAQVVFVGDSITQGWEGAGAKVWEEHMQQLGAINLGIGGDRTEHVIWRLENGNLEGISPKVAIVMIGTNNFGYQQDSIEEVLEGVVAVVEKLQKDIPGVNVVLLDIFPRGEVFNEMRGNILQVNQSLQAKYEGVNSVTFFPIGHLFLEDDGTISKKIMPDYLHLSEEGYQRWADAIVPTVSLFLGRSTVVQRPPVRPPPNILRHKPDLTRAGPWDNDVLVYMVQSDGSANQISTFERAGVPTIGRFANGRLIAAHQWFPEDDDEAFDTIAVRFSDDNGNSWTDPESLVFEGLDKEARYPFDPTIVVLEDERVRLYFTYMVGSRIFEEATPGISSAISYDSIHFVKEEGMRLEIEDVPVIDCSVVLHRNTWHLISPYLEDNTPMAYHATSKDGLLFKRVRDISFNDSFRWLGCMLMKGRSLVFYGTRHHGAPASARQGGLPTATSTSGSRWKAGEPLLVQGADPGVVLLEDGSSIVVVTGPPREGTASREQMQQRRKPKQPPDRPQRGTPRRR